MRSPSQWIAVLGVFISAIGLCIVGIQMTAQEARLLAARETAHAVSLRGARIQPIRLANAIREFDGQDIERFDIRLFKLRLELALAVTQGSGGYRDHNFLSSIKRAQRFAESVVRIAPLNSEAWCARPLLAAQAKQHDLVPGRLQQCYSRSQWELGTVGPRLRLTMAYWPFINGNLRAAAMQDIKRIISRPESKHYALKVMPQLATSISPEHENELREMIAEHEPNALKRFDFVVKRYRTQIEK